MLSFEIFEVDQITPEVSEAVARLMPQLNSTSPSPSREQLGEIVKSPASFLFLARDLSQGLIVGMLGLGVFRSMTGVHAWIEDVVVDGAFRRRGIGEALTRAAITRAAGLKARSVCLTSRAARDAANQLYQRMGFMKRETNLYEFKIG